MFHTQKHLPQGSRPVRMHLRLGRSLPSDTADRCAVSRPSPDKPQPP